jgi:hypothetical protein
MNTLQQTQRLTFSQLLTQTAHNSNGCAENDFGWIAQLLSCIVVRHWGGNVGAGAGAGAEAPLAPDPQGPQLACTSAACIRWKSPSRIL